MSAMPRENAVLPATERLDWSLIAGVCMLRNEADIIAANLEHLIGYGLKTFLLYDDGSTDGSQAIVEDIKGRHPGVEIITIQGNGNFLQKRFIVRRMTQLARDVLGKEWAFCFDADDFLWLSLGLKIDLANTSAYYILLPWLHVNPADIEPDSYVVLAGRTSLTNIIAHKCKTLVRISETVRLKGGQHNVVNDRLFPAIGLDGMVLGMASVHFPVRSEEQIVSKYAMSEVQRDIQASEEVRLSKHRNSLRKLSEADARKLYKFIVRRDKEGFLAFCDDLGVTPQMFDYLVPIICNKATAFPHPVEGWKSKYFPKRFHWVNSDSTPGKLVGSVARRFVRVDSSIYRAATPDEVELIK